jgi:hypothetical protein
MYAEQFFEEHNVKVHKKTQFTSKTAEELGYSHVIECLGYTFKTEFMKKSFENCLSSNGQIYVNDLF